MSRVGAKPVEIPSGVKVTVEGGCLRAKGAVGELTLDFPPMVSAAVEGNQVKVVRQGETRDVKSLHGLSRSLVVNMLEGVSKGFSKALEIEGVGFRATLQGQNLTIALGFASPVEYTVPEGVKVVVQDGTKVGVSGPDKQKVGDVAARIRSFYPVEPYKGKGIKYKGEHVRRKVGKTVA